jgi:hypothetical protein
VTEEQFQATVIAMCKLFAVAWYHPFFSRRSAAGWPDLALCGDNGFLLRELKTEKGRLTKDQQAWGSRLRNAGVSWDVWRPADLNSGRIQKEIEAIR